MVPFTEGSESVSLFTGREARNFVRATANFAVRIKTGGVDLWELAAFAYDLSTGGLGLVVSEQEQGSFEKLKKLGEPVDVELDLPDGKRLCLRAEVVWGKLEQRKPERRYRMGLRFLDAEAEKNEALAAYVKSKVFDHLFPPKE